MASYWHVARKLHSAGGSRAARHALLLRWAEGAG